MIAVIAIIALNLIVTIIGFRAFKSQEEPEKFLFIPYMVARGENLKGLLFSQFAHAGWMHLGFNMISFIFFAPGLAAAPDIGPLGMVAIYVISGIGADALVFLLKQKDPQYSALGASGSVSGIIFAAIVVNPHMSLIIFPVPIPIPAPIFAIGYLALSFYLSRRGDLGGISHEAHIGGALTGFAAAAILSKNGLGPLLMRLQEFLPG